MSLVRHVAVYALLFAAPCLLAQPNLNHRIVGQVTDPTASAITVESTTGELGFTVTGEQAGELQLNGRNFPELLQLLPGVSTTYTDGFGLFGGYGVNNSGQSINGGRTDSTTWNLNGGDNKDN